MTETLIPAWLGDTLSPVEKLDAHIRGLKHKAISVFVLKGDEVLIQRRAMGKYHTPGLWANTCCTHPNWEESSINCAQRRLREELGIEGLNLEYRDRVEYRADVGGGLIEHEVVDVFVAKVDKAPEINLNPDEVMATRWVRYADLIDEVVNDPSRFTPWLRIYLDTYASQIFGELAKTCVNPA
ncbi:isopentenyl-diphosphate Delta-isomerase [Marivita hallyeonensis]|uniref:Isopentenyl-diphosphate Delta-isomerase n=1 Tax=Marivita hallyeonensis TaxID=996342 RepID=A0A1M5UG43_9RHOB|nr:isopentenyl-diphosphate Delta-isomerase [Marivita hallyeonensis]SHH62022.1 isopentenyl-diphosphate delta-isomerase [Marivita hallyeonensis]